MATRRQSILTLSMRGALALLLLSTFGCAGQAWKQASSQDTPSAYHRFMRDHGDSKYADAARERLEFHKLKRNPTLAGFEVFRKKFPESELFEELQPMLEAPAFEVAIAQGTAPAYRSFLEAFPNGLLAARAEGNAAYVEAGGFGGDAAALSNFAIDHPESDFAAEAERTASATAMRRAARFDRIGLVLEVDPSTPEAKRVREALLDRIRKETDRLALEVVEVPMTITHTASRSLSFRFRPAVVRCTKFHRSLRRCHPEECRSARCHRLRPAQSREAAALRRCVFPEY